MKKNILVTGCAGLIGSIFCQWLIDNTDYSVIGIDDLSGGYIENLPKNNKFIFYKITIGNNNDYNLLEQIFINEKIDYVLHAAAYATEGLSPFIRMFNYENNLIASMALVNLSIKYNVKRFVFTSSMAVYGNQQTPFSEDLIPEPIDSYGVAKYAVEMDLKIANEQHNLDYCIIRPHNVVSRKQNLWDPYRNVIAIFMYQSLNNLPITIYGDGEQKRAFTATQNIVEPLWKSTIQDNASKQIINLGGIKEYTINEIAKIISEITGNKNIIYLEPRHEVKNAWSTYQKSIDLLDYKENMSLYDCLIDMWQWAKEQPIRKRFVWDKYELDNGLYKFWKKENIK